MDRLEQLIQCALQSPLPGWEAQKKLSPKGADLYLEVRPDHINAAVLILLSPVNGIPHLTLIKRASHFEEDKHKGQISFPGGKQEPNENLRQTAIRETFEEIGVKETDYTIHGELTPLYVFVSNFMIYPFIASSRKELKFRLDGREVDRVIMTPLSSFTTGPSTIDIPVKEMTLKDVPYFPIENEVLWGATSMITSEFLHLIQ